MHHFRSFLESHETGEAGSGELLSGNDDSQKRRKSRDRKVKQ